jgi:ribonuclease-3
VLKSAAFTHLGINREKDSGKRLDYERLEWLGDAYMELLASCFIFQTFGALPVGRCSQMREGLVKNTTLSRYFRMYNMGREAVVPTELKRVRDSVVPDELRDVIKVQGDMFEAFVAAVILSDPIHGVTTAGNWLKALWASTIKQEILEVHRKPELGQVAELGDEPSNALPAKVRLAQTIMVKGVVVRYEEQPSKKQLKDKLSGCPIFHVSAFLDGWGETNKFLGSGTGLSKKDAGEKAAQEALLNKKMMKTLEEKKRAYKEAQLETAEKLERPL